jgi:sugar O-acyltransferase (sialic acid O-acetyltransferase NeuD family)
MSEASLLIWGAGGHGRVVADLARLKGYKVVGYIDINPHRVGTVVDKDDTRVLLSEKDLEFFLMRGEPLPGGASLVALGIGDNEIRLRCLSRLGGRCAPALVHPKAVVASTVSVGPGTVIMAGAVVNDQASLGRGAIVNSGAIVEHDCVLHDGVHISPGAVLAGGVMVETLAWIGAGATVLPQVKIGPGAIVGAGAVVLRDVASGTTVVGNPARIIRTGL